MKIDYYYFFFKELIIKEYIALSCEYNIFYVFS